MFARILITLALMSSTAYGETVLEFQTNPPLDQILPDAETANLQFMVKQNGKVVEEEVRFKVKITTPKTNPLLSTDFPIVEGTQLVYANVDRPNGQFDLKYLLPIRGEYTLDVSASLESGEHLNLNETFVIKENPQEVKNLVVFLALIAAFAIMCGIVLGKNARNQMLNERSL